MNNIFKYTIKIIILLLVILPLNLKSQEQSVGLRMGITSGLNYKQQSSYENAFELILGNKNDGRLVTTLYEFYQPASALLRDRFFYYYGFGLHIGYYKEKYKYTITDNNGNEVIEERTRLFPATGFDGIVGFEYRFNVYPVVVSLDYKPNINLFGPYRYLARGIFDFGLSVRYVFNK